MFRRAFRAATLLLLAPPLAAAEGLGERCDALNDGGNYSEALPVCEASVAEARASGALVDVATALNGLGFALEMTGDRALAERSYREALALYRELGARDREAVVLSNLAALAIGGGDYGRALDFLAQEEILARSAGPAPWVAEELRIVSLNRGVALEQLGAYREALAELRELARQPEPDPEHAAALQVNLAVLYRNLGDPRHALRLLDEARDSYSRIGDRSALANVHLNRALVLSLNLAQPDAARDELTLALRLAREGGDRGEELRILQASGELELGAANLRAARRDFGAALELARSSGAVAGEWSALAALGRVEQDAGNSEAALERLREAGAILERASAGVGDSALGSSLLRDQRRLYATAVDLLGERALAGDGGAALEALAWSERLKDRELLDALAGARAAPPASTEELAALGRRFGPTLAYFAGARRLWRWWLDEHGVAMHDAGPVRETLARARRVQADLARGESPVDAELVALSAALLPPDLPAEGRLRVAPDAALFYLPFALLADPADPERRLVESRSLCSIPSLSVLMRLETGEAARRWRFAALADPRFPASNPSAAGGGVAATGGAGALLAARLGLPPLPGSEREARSAARHLGEPSVIDLAGEASETRFLTRAGEGAGVLHLAAHTLVDESLAEGVAIFLAADGANDGLLTPGEIAGAQIDADLVVLSGCRTALANEISGPARALASLSGAILAAGARAVVASLWEVGDDATAALMEGFYFELARGHDAAEALRRAQSRMARDRRWGAPHLWAGFVLAGEPPRFAARRRSPLFLGAAGLLVLGGLALWRRRVTMESGDPR